MIHTTNVIRDKNRIFRNEKLDPAALINSKLEFNAEMFKVGKRIGGSERITAALLKLPNDRTKSDILALEVMMKMLPGFSQYSLKVKQELGKVIGYSKFDLRRTILKQ
ncbi:hypothetical protein HDU99_002366, partial [Rhizoclosmatium hyalinum]